MNAILRFAAIYGASMLITLAVALFLAPWRSALALVAVVVAITLPAALRRFQEDARQSSARLIPFRRRAESKEE